MQRCITIITAIIISAKILFAGSSPDFYIQGEYRNNSIDYSDVEMNFYRERIELYFSKTSSINFTHVYIEEEKENRYTYSLALKDISPRLSLTAGNFYTNFASGLLIGRKRSYNINDFNARIFKSDYEAFAPCKNGNPVFAFHGISASINDGEFFKNRSIPLKLSLDAFYSFKERFTSGENYESGNIDSTLSSIDYKYQRTSIYDEPVNIITHGSMLTAEIQNIIFLKTYYILSNIKTPRDQSITWDSFEYENSSYGISGLFGMGGFARYKDKFLDIIYDFSGTRTTIESIGDNHDNTSKYQKAGNANLFRIKFTPPLVSISITKKRVDSSFYSPYTSCIGSDYPEDAWFFNFSIKPYKNMEIGASSSSQREKYPSAREDEPELIEREKVYLSYKYGLLKKLELKLSLREKNSTVKK